MLDIKLKNNNRNNGAGNNNVSANNDASSNSGASRNNGAGNSSNNSNAVNSSKRIIIAIAGIIFITIITMCFFPVVYRTAERQKEQQKAEMMRESSDSVDNDTVQTLYQGSYVLYVEQMERSGQADAGGGTEPQKDFLMTNGKASLRVTAGTSITVYTKAVLTA